MATRILSGAYGAGYIASPSVTLLKPQASANVGGAGVAASATPQVENLGTVGKDSPLVHRPALASPQAMA